MLYLTFYSLFYDGLIQVVVSTDAIKLNLELPRRSH